MGGKSSNSTQSSTQVDSRQVNTTTVYDTWNTTNNNTYTTDTRYDLQDDHSVSLGSGAMLATGGGVINMTDGGAIRGALDLADTISADAFKTTGGVVTDAFSFGSDLANYFGKAINANAGRSLDSVDSAVSAGAGLATKALNFADASQANAFDFGQALAKLFGQQINASSGRAFDSVDAATAALQAGNKSALSTVDSVTGNAFGFGEALAKLFGNQINAGSARAFDSVDAATKAASASSTRALDLVGSFGADALKANTDTSRGAFNLIDSITATLSRDNAATAQKLGTQAFSTADSMAQTFASTLAGNSDKATRGLLDTVSAMVASFTGAQQKSDAAALALAGDMADRQTSFLSGVLASQAKATDAVTNLVANAYNDAKGRGAQTDTMLMVAIGGALLVAFFAIKR